MAADQVMEEINFMTSELHSSVSELAQRVRRAINIAQNEPLAPDWLGTSAQLTTLMEGSLFFTSSGEGGETLIIPPVVSGCPTVRILAGHRCVRVSRDGASVGTKFTKVTDVLSSCAMGALGVVTMDGHSGSRAKLATAGGGTAVLTVSRAPDGRPEFVLKSSADGSVLSSGADAKDVMRIGGIEGVLQSSQVIQQGPEWGLPAAAVPTSHVPLSEVAVASPQFQEFSATLITVGGACPTDCKQFWEFVVALADVPPTRATVDELVFASTPAEELQRSVPVGVATQLAALCGKAVGLSMRVVTKLPPACRTEANSFFATLTESPDWAQVSTFVKIGGAVRAAVAQSEGAPELVLVPWTPSSIVASPVRPVSLVSGHTRSARASPARVPPGPGASGARATAQRDGAAGDATDVGDIDIMSPGSLRRHLKRLVHGAAPEPAPTPGTLGATTPTALRTTDATLGIPAGAAHDIAAAVTFADAMQRFHGSRDARQALLHILPAWAAPLPVATFAAMVGAHGLADAASVLAQAAGDNLRPPAGSVLEGELMLSRIGQVFDDVVEADATFDMFATPAATDWGDGVLRLTILLSAHAAAFRVKRRATASQQPSSSGTAAVATSADKPPVGSFKAVCVAAKEAKTSACATELLDGMASVDVLRREHVRPSSFKDLSLSTRETRDVELEGELCHFYSTYGQGALAYVCSNGMCTSALSGAGVPMALHGVRVHMLGRARRVIDEAFGEERAAAVESRSQALALSLLTGLQPTLLPECVFFLGGSAPHADAEIDAEGASISTGVAGAVTGEGADASIRDAVSIWAEGFGRTIGALPGVEAGPRNDFGFGAMLRSVKGRVQTETLLSICRFVLVKVWAALYKLRSEHDRCLPDVSQIISEAGSKVFKERRTEERLRAIAREEAAAARPAGRGQGLTTVKAETQSDAPKRSRWGRKLDTPAGAAAISLTPSTAVGTSAQQLADAFLSTLPPVSTALSAPGGAPGAQPAKVIGNRPIDNRLHAIVELSALWRAKQGWAPGQVDASKEPCAPKALFGECTSKVCKRCQSGLSFPQTLVASVLERGVPGWKDRSGKSSDKGPGNKAGAPAAGGSSTATPAGVSGPSK